MSQKEQTEYKGKEDYELLAVKELEETLEEPRKLIPLYDYMILSCFAVRGLHASTRAIDDAYMLGYMAGKKHLEKDNRKEGE